MPGFLRAATIVLTGSAVLYAGVLAFLPSTTEGLGSGRASASGVPIAELPRASCKQQLWPNTDRICQSWTIANKEVSDVLSAPASPRMEFAVLPQIAALSKEPATEAGVDPLQPNANDALGPVEAKSEISNAPTAAPATHEEKSAAPIAHTRDTQREIAVTAQSGDGTRRIIKIRPTSRQDNYYYAAHRDLAATALSAFHQ
jgi:hypothetical protein